MALLPSQHRGGNLGKAIPRHDAGYYDVDKSPLGSVQELSQHLDACSWAFSVCNSSTPMPRNCSSTNTAQGAHLNLPNLHPTSSSKELEELRPQMLRTLLCSEGSASLKASRLTHLVVLELPEHYTVWSTIQHTSLSSLAAIISKLALPISLDKSISSLMTCFSCALT
jgi:hypothetical protein